MTQKNILIVEDNNFIQHMLSKTLEDAGYGVDCALHGQEGIQKCNARDFDLVITDMNMPDTDGLHVIAAMRYNHPDLPIIAISGGDPEDPENKDLLVEAGEDFVADGFLVKPIKKDELLAMTERLLSSVW